MDETPQPFAHFAEAIVAEAKRIEEDATFSAKGHFEAARRWDGVHLWIGIPTTLVAAAAGVSALKDLKALSAVLSLLVAASSAVFTFLNAETRSARHLKAGNAYKALQNDARIFYQVQCQQGRRPPELSAALQELNKTRNKLNSDSPQIPRRAFEAARQGIEGGESTYQVDRSE